MSDSWIILVPDDPFYVPDDDRQERARRRLSEIAPESDVVECENHERVRFFDGGSNLESIRCPNCKAAVPMDWWGNTMSNDYQDGFGLASYEMPCCGSKLSLDQLIYDRPSAFGRFGLSARNLNLKRLEPKHISEFNDLLNCKLKLIWRHL